VVITAAIEAIITVVVDWTKSRRMMMPTMKKTTYGIVR
jgi:hypothetical protein